MDMMITTMDQDAEFSEFDADKVIKATSLAMIFGGIDNTTLSMALTLAALLNNPVVLKKVQDELEIHVGKNRVVDVENLTYLQAVIKEVFRLYPSAQLNVPHEATEDCQIQGFNVPDTRINATDVLRGVGGFNVSDTRILSWNEELYSKESQRRRHSLLERSALK